MRIPNLPTSIRSACLSERAIISMLTDSSKKHLSPRDQKPQIRNKKEGIIMKRVIKLDRAGAFISVSLLLIVSAATVVQSQSQDAKRIAEATKEAQKAADVFT